MNGINNGGPAFGFVQVPDPNDATKVIGAGMTLRDYFAGQALAGIASRQNYHGIATAPAKEAYAIADAMLAAREQAP